MYISIERNPRGSLDIEQRALNKLIQSVVVNCLPVSVIEAKNVNIETEMYHDNLMYILVKLKIDNLDYSKEIKNDEKKITKNIEDAIHQTLNIKPKNIAISYSRY